MQVSATGIAWYRAEDYDRLKTMFTDGGKLPPDFQSWLKAAENLYDKLTSQSHIVVKAYIDPDVFPEWCRTHGQQMDAKGRMAYGNECAAKTNPAWKGN